MKIVFCLRSILDKVDHFGGRSGGKYISDGSKYAEVFRETSSEPRTLCGREAVEYLLTVPEKAEISFDGISDSPRKQFIFLASFRGNPPRDWGCCVSSYDLEPGDHIVIPMWEGEKTPNLWELQVYTVKKRFSIQQPTDL